MINNEIKLYKDLVEVEITDFKGNNETLFWEGTVIEFWKKYQTLKAMSFPIHGGRVEAMQTIQGFKEAKWNIKTLQQKISWLDETEQLNIKSFVKEYKNKFKKYPSNGRINNLIFHILNPSDEAEKEYKQWKESEKIREIKKKRFNCFELLLSNEKEHIIKKSWDRVKKIRIWCNISNFREKSLFILVKNELLDELIQAQNERK